MGVSEQGGTERKVLVIDTDAGVRWSLERGLAHSGYLVYLADGGDAAMRMAAENEIDLVLMEFHPQSGLTLDVLKALVTLSQRPAVVCTSIFSEPNVVIDCMRHGAMGFIGKPFSLAAVRSELAKAAKPQAQGNGHKPAPPVSDGQAEGSLLIGVSKAVQELRAIIKQVAQTDLNCLIRGESGVGKDLVAREIYRLSLRHEHPFIKVNCSALPEQLLESELFGYEKGAFTGALASKPGRFSLANKGIIFLDEIGEVEMGIQAKLLQVIEHKEFMKLGARRPSKVDVQIVAATNVDIESQTRKGLFRQDLFFRLNEVCVWVPSLNNRKEDIPFLVRHFVQKHNRFMGNEQMEISGAQMSELCARDWPGNVRELESTIKRWMALRTHDVAPQAAPLFAAAPQALAEPVAAPTASPDAPYIPTGEDTPSPKEILRVLEECQWNRRKATEVLGMSYQALRRRIIKYKLDQRF